MYLSQLSLNAQSMQVRQDIGNLYDLHRTLNSALPDLSKEGDQSARDKFQVLYRTEFNLRKNQINILVQSLIEPKWSLITRKFSDYFSSPPQVRDISTEIKKLETGHILRFRLKANPTKRLRKDEKSSKNEPKKKIGPRIPLKTDDDLIQWLIRKGNDCGFKPAQLKISKETPIYNLMVSAQSNDQTYQVLIGGSSQKGHKKNQTMTFYGVTFDGFLIITDVKKFLDGLNKGIGSGKAFGYGLLSIAPS